MSTNEIETETTTSEPIWHRAGAFGYEQAFIDGRRYTAGRPEGMRPGTGFGAASGEDLIGVFTTVAEAKAACVGFARGLGGPAKFAVEVPSHWRPIIGCTRTVG